MTLYEAIKYEEEVVQEYQYEYQECITVHDMEKAMNCVKYGEEHRQLAEWLKELKQLREQTRWIPVSEKLPEPDVEVLVTDDAGGLATISTDSIYESEVTGEKEWYASQNVTAWMSLPQAYKAETEDA